MPSDAEELRALYQYQCPRWYGTRRGVRSVGVESEEEASAAARADANASTGSERCSVSLLHLYGVSIRSVKTYPTVARLSMGVERQFSPSSRVDRR